MNILGTIILCLALAQDSAGFISNREKLANIKKLDFSSDIYAVKQAMKEVDFSKYPLIPAKKLSQVYLKYICISINKLSIGNIIRYGKQSYYCARHDLVYFCIFLNYGLILIHFQGSIRVLSLGKQKWMCANCLRIWDACQPEDKRRYGTLFAEYNVYSIWSEWMRAKVWILFI